MFQRCCQFVQRVFVKTRERTDFFQLQMTLGEGAGFIKHHTVYLIQYFQYMAFTD